MEGNGKAEKKIENTKKALEDNKTDISQDLYDRLSKFDIKRMCRAWIEKSS